jgi:phosphatidate cytidylyltransferase
VVALPAAGEAAGFRDLSRAETSVLKSRILTGLAVGFFALALILWSPLVPSFVLWLLVTLIAVHEFNTLGRRLAPTAPLAALFPAVPIVACAGFLALDHPNFHVPVLGVLSLAATPLIFAGCATLWGGTAMKDGLASLGLLAFALPYFSLPAIAVVALIEVDRWLLFLCVAIVAFGDSAAYFIGMLIGKHRIAPLVSPKKTWEGSIAGFLAGIGTAALWSHFRFGQIDQRLLIAAAATALAAQVGDLVESLMKRAVDVKDSSQLLPGHGGMLDRLDAMFFAAPVFSAVLWLTGYLPGRS